MIYLQIFIAAFFLNLLWEVLHSPLYTTCHEMPLGKMQRLLVSMSLKDGFWITLFYWITVLVSGNIYIVEHVAQLTFFAAIALVFSFVDEYISVKKRRWIYADTMPTVLGVGITPLLELVITGVITLSIVFLIL